MNAPRARVFFALWPDPAARGLLAAAAQGAQAECGGRATAAEKIHATLFFVGDIDRSRIDALQAIGAAMSGAYFALEVNALKYWHHNRIVWAGAAQCPQALSALVAELTRALAAVGVAAEERAYVPHVTLVRNARHAPKRTRLTPFEWAARDFVLVESVRSGEASRYDVLARWPLGTSV